MFLRPFGGLGLQTLSHIPGPNADKPKPAELLKSTENPRMQVYQDAHGNKFLQSVTEVATPSPRPSQEPFAPEGYAENIAHMQVALSKIAGPASEPESAVVLRESSQEDGSSRIHIKQSGSNPAKDICSVSDENHDPKLIPRLRTLVNHLAEFPPKMRNHDHRLEVLENTSWSNAAIEDLQDADNRLEEHVGDLQERVLELEKARAAWNDASSVGSRQIDGSFSSKVSNVDISRIEALEAEVAELQAAAMPTYTRPWEIEVVFLPYGPQLMGVWSQKFSSSQSSRSRSNASNDWTQTQNNSMAAAQARLTATDSAAWEQSASDLGNQEDTPWLMARACGLRSRVDERLRSRGLVKLAYIRGPDARDVQAAIMTAFGDLPDVLIEDPYTKRDENAGTIPKPLKNYLGLGASWLPLRKLHKDSCLRFLNPSEMVTPALWTVPFLSSSVAMRHSGVRRLYVTQRDSYIQHLSPSVADWTWQKLRQLPRVYPDQPSSDHTPEADAHEPCWEFDDRLDPPHESIHSSFASHISQLSIHELEEFSPESPSDHFSSAAVSPHASTTPTSIAPPTTAPLSPLKERNPFRPIHIRTTSLPQLVRVKSNPHSSQPLQLSSKRRIASFEQSSPTRPHQPSLINTTLPKRRRISRSPSRAPGDAMRWSTGPPSPYTINNNSEEAQPTTAKRERERGMTPFAYATPHSNAPYVPRSEIGIWEDGEGEERVDSDGYEGTQEFEERQVDSEWEGVGNSEFDPRISGSVPLGGDRKGNGDEDDRDGDAMSDTSSTPSEYPSTQQHHMGSGSASISVMGLGFGSGGGGSTVMSKAGFRIHVDEDEDEGDDEL